MFKWKFITRNALLTEIKSWPREHAREEGFESISSDAMSICHETSIKLLLVVDKLYLVHCFKICFSYVLPVPTEFFKLIKKTCLLGEIARNYGVTWDDIS